MSTENNGTDASDRFKIIYKASQKLNRTLDVSILNNTLREIISDATRCDGYYVSSYDPTKKLISCISGWHEKKEIDISKLPPLPLEPEGQGTQSRVIRSGKSLLTGDYQKLMKEANSSYYIGDEGKIHDEVPEDAEVTQSAMIVPLKLEEKVVGVIQIFSYKKDFFTEDQLELIESLSTHISLAIKNAYLYQKAQEEISERKRTEKRFLDEAKINTALAALYKPLVSAASTLNDITITILNQVRNLTGSKHGYVSTIDPNTNENIIHTFTEMLKNECNIKEENRRIAFPMNKDGTYNGLWGYALNTKKSFYTNSPKTHSSTKGIPDGHIILENFLSVPVMLEDILVGQIALANSDRDYKDSDIYAIQRIAEYYAIAIQQFRSREALLDSERRFRGLFENSTIGIYRATLDGKILMANPTFLLITGTTSLNEFSLMELANNGYVDEKERNEFMRILKEEKTIFGFEEKWKKPDGNIIYIRESARTIDDDKGNIVYYEGTLEDITESKKAELELITAKEKAEESSRLKTSFLANMSHEIRTPLNGILGFADIIKDKLNKDGNDELSSFAGIIHTSGKRLLHLLDNILDISKIEANKIELTITECDLNVVTSSVVNILLPSAKSKKLEMEYIPEEELIVLADINRLNTIVKSIVDNAIKFTDEGSVIINTGTDESKNMAYLEIKDTGIGIDKEFLPKIFDTFRQEDEKISRKYEGGGLGLSISKKLVNLMDGDIDIESVKGKGTTVKIFLPLSNSVNKNEEIITKMNSKINNLDNEEFLRKLKPNILVVEDDEYSGKLLKLMLFKIANVFLANTGEASLELISERKKNKQLFDAVLMDIRLPKPWDGMLLKDEIRRRWNEYSKVPFIAQTAYAEKDDKKIMQAGFEDCITKPITLDELFYALVKQLQK